MGQKRAFSVSEARRLKAILRERVELRDLVLASVAFDSCLRSCDLLALKWDDFLNHTGQVRDRVTIRQRKTGANVTVLLSEVTCQCLQALEHRGLYVFAGSRPERSLTSRQYRRIVKRWAQLLGLDVRVYGTHSLRRTKPAEVYRKTGNAELARILLGQKSLLATHRYLGLEQEDALAVGSAVKL